MRSVIPNFSKLNRDEKLTVLHQQGDLPADTARIPDEFLVKSSANAKVLNELSENTISHFAWPFGIAPNFIINNKVYHVPMVTEESSVIAAASKAAKIWSGLGGFVIEQSSSIKCGQVHFTFSGKYKQLIAIQEIIKIAVYSETEFVTRHMQARGGGIVSIELIDKSKEIGNYYQLFLRFNTVDAMGANFINSCLEIAATALQRVVNLMYANERLEILMSILSNFNPESIVKCKVQCKIQDLGSFQTYFSADKYVERFKLAIDIANNDVFRAVTHNKGIMNGIDAVCIATGNDFRAIEAGAHAYASRNGRYCSLTRLSVTQNIFEFSIEIPLSIGTVGGITKVHPLCNYAHQILGNPSSAELSGIIASVGLASNFAAIHALITQGIQKGHMKMHLSNILLQLGANEMQTNDAITYFKDKTVTYSDVEKFLKSNGT